MTWLAASLWWYIMLVGIGFLFFPLTKKIFGSFNDHGYPFAKTIGILLISYTAFVLGVIHLIPFNVWGIVGIVGVWGGVNFWLNRKKQSYASPKSKKIFIVEEFLFFASFLLLSYIRGQEPSLRGLEKFMDYGFIQSILKSQYFPPADIWYAGESINYYYFGHLASAILIKLSGLQSSLGYNLTLANLFALAVTQSFSLIVNLIQSFADEAKKTVSQIRLVIMGFIGSLLLNIAGNLHTIYLFTKGYPNDKPIEFWKILSWFNPAGYWYPNATRFIPLTIHEFPSYSYVVADLHGHVLDIPFVLLTLGLLFVFFRSKHEPLRFGSIQNTVYGIRYPVLFGFMTAVHYMTNAFDGPIYLLLIFTFYLLVLTLGKRFFIFVGVTLVSFIFFSLPFSIFFKPFASGIGLNCAADFLTQIQKLGPFLFEKGNCQPSPLWMMVLLWGFFWMGLAVLLWCIYSYRKSKNTVLRTDIYAVTLLVFGFVLVWIPEFFYVKDIYPAHFRANTMFKLGYQAFIMGSIASAYTLFRVSQLKHSVINAAIRILLAGCLFLVFLYPFSMVSSYYGALQKTPDLEGTQWLSRDYPETYEIVNYLNTKVNGQVRILEASGDSYTDFNVVSSYTGNPTVAGWRVHEWLWRGSPQFVDFRLPDITTIYESENITQTRDLLDLYQIDYVVVTPLEKEKYPHLYEKKFEVLGEKVFVSKNGFGALYRVK